MTTPETTPTVTSAFQDWCHAELASHYAQPCPDEVMNHLVNDTWKRIDDLTALPATSAEDILFKLFPLLMATFEPKSGDPPMVPVFGENNGFPDLLTSTVEDIRRLCPMIAEAMKAPHYLDQKRAA